MDVLERKCLFDKEILQKYIDNTIDPLEFIFLKEHLKVCVDCKEEVASLTQIDDSLAAYFRDEDFSDEIAQLTDKLISDCVNQIEEKKKLFWSVRKNVEISIGITRNATRFTNHIPGNKEIQNGAAFLRGYLKKRFEKSLQKRLSGISYRG